MWPDIYEQEGWPRLSWDREALTDRLAALRHRQGELIGRMGSMGFAAREGAVLQTLTEDVSETSRIEGETLDKQQVRSSLARRLGVDIGALTPADRNVEGVGIAVFNQARVSKLSVGNVVLENVLIAYPDGAMPEHFSPHLGMDVISRLRLLVDMPGKKLYVKKAEKQRGGLIAIRDPGIMVDK